jgi:hypothetical protein
MGRELLTSIRQFTTSVDGSDAMNAVLVAQEIIKLVGEKVCAAVQVIPLTACMD